MRIISWNVNGIRAISRKDKFKWLLEQKPDIFCLQETKARQEQLSKKISNPEGYHPYFSSHETKKGYSGVVTYTKKEPDDVETHTEGPLKDDEGRIVTTFYNKTALLNVYFPNGGGGEDRLKYKLQFYDDFLEYIIDLREEGYKIIFCGDVNTAHEEIDLARPKENETNTGFLPEERAWIDEVINAGFVDAFRYLYPNKEGVYTYWDYKTRARDRNVGWRIDYFFVSNDLAPKIKNFKTHTDVLGSDHCPVELTVEV